MIPGSASPLWFPDWLHSVTRGLIVGGENPPYALATPPVAFDGVGGREPRISIVTATFAGSAITRSDPGSFLDDGWAIGMTVTVADSLLNDGPAGIVATVSATALTLTGETSFIAETDTAGVSLAGAINEGFALYVGPQHLQDWTGADVCVLVPSIGAPGNGLQARRTATDRRALMALDFAVDIHVWGLEPPEQVRLGAIEWDIERYRAPCAILQNVLRVMAIFARGFQAITSVDGWSNDTEKLRYGEAFGATFSISFPIYDFPDTMLPSGLKLTGQGQPTIKAPGAP